MFTYDIGYALGETADTEDMNTAVMGYPDDKSRLRVNRIKDSLELEDRAKMLPDDDVSGPHVTIRFWRNDKPVPKKILDYLDERFKNIVVDTHTKAWDIIGKDKTLVLLLEKSDSLMELQEEVDEKLQEMGVEPSDYPEYLPHVSVAENVTKVPEQAHKIRLRFNRWIINTRNQAEKEAAVPITAYDLGFALGSQGMVKDAVLAAALAKIAPKLIRGGARVGKAGISLGRRAFAPAVKAVTQYVEPMVPRSFLDVPRASRFVLGRGLVARFKRFVLATLGDMTRSRLTERPAPPSGRTFAPAIEP